MAQRALNAYRLETLSGLIRIVEDACHADDRAEFEQRQGHGRIVEVDLASLDGRDHLLRQGVRVDFQTHRQGGPGAHASADPAHEIKGVLVVHNETATGVTSDVAAIRRAIDATGHPALLYVDVVSSLASIPVEFDGWGVDLAITGSQKGLGLPAGLGIVCASQRGLGVL